MSIYSASGLKTPTFQPANSKGDGAGNGSGGMYFGPPVEEPPPAPNYFSDPMMDYGLDDMPYNVPPRFSSSETDMLALWKLALAKKLYAEIHRIQAE